MKDHQTYGNQDEVFGRWSVFEAMTSQESVSVEGQVAGVWATLGEVKGR